MSVHSSAMLMSETTGVDTNMQKGCEVSSFGNPKAFFHLQNKTLGCHQEMASQKIDIRECHNARDYCDMII